MPEKSPPNVAIFNCEDDGDWVNVKGTNDNTKPYIENACRHLTDTANRMGLYYSGHEGPNKPNFRGKIVCIRIQEEEKRIMRLAVPKEGTIYSRNIECPLE